MVELRPSRPKHEIGVRLSFAFVYIFLSELNAIYFDHKVQYCPGRFYSGLLVGWLLGQQVILPAIKTRKLIKEPAHTNWGLDLVSLHKLIWLVPSGVQIV